MATEKDTIDRKDKSPLAKNILCAVGAGVLVQGAAGTANASSLPYIIVSPRYQAQAYGADDAQPDRSSAGSTAVSEQAGAQADEESTAQAEQIENGAPVEMEKLESFDDEAGQSRSEESKRAVDGNFSGQDVEAKNATMTFEPPKVIRPVEKRHSYEDGAGQSGIKARVAEILRLYDENKRSSPYAAFAEGFQAKRHMHSGVINGDQAAKNEKSFWRNDGSGAIEENKDVEVDKSRSNVSGKSDRVQQDAAFAEPAASVPEERVEKAVLPQDLASRADIVQVPDEAPAESVSEPMDTGDDFEFKPSGGYSRYDISDGSRADASAANPVQQRNPWAAIDAEKKAKEQQRSERTDGSDIQRNTPIFGADDDDVASPDKMMMVERFRRPAPGWTHEVLQRLASEGLLAPEDAGRSFDSLTRREGAVLTARSFNIYRTQRGHRANGDTMIPSQRNYSFARHDIDRLMREFAIEVEALGYNIIDQVTDTKVVYKNEYDWKFGGELRYSFEKNSGAPRYTWSDHRIRGRIYADKAISPNWMVHGLLEVDKHNFFDKDDAAAVSDEDDGDLELSRIYLEGNYNWWNMPVTLELGKTYAYLAEGNVLDSDFDGLKITAKPDGNTIYSAGYGQVNDSEDMYYLEGSLRNRNQDYLGGYYHWDNYGSPTSIWAAGTNYYTGNYTLGGMYLKANRPDGSGADDGYVLSARYGKNFPWIAHTYEFDLKYYNMAGNTYINHTMNGVGNYMNGFEGWGAMAYYTPVENWVLGLEYYDLKDKTTDEKGKTLWASLSYSF